jgi:hypothetical protein
VGHQFIDLPAWEFSIVTNSVGATYTIRAVRDGGIAGEMSGEDVDGLFDRARRWAQSTDTGLLVRRALAAVEPLIAEAFVAVGHRPPAGSGLDQVGLADGAEIVVDYLAHGEIGLALDHLFYMIVEPPLLITDSTFQILREVAERLGTEHRQLEQARRLVQDDAP